MVCFRWLVGLGLLALTFSAYCDTTPAQWLQRMVQAGKNLDYRGTFVYMRDQQLQVMEIRHGSHPSPGWQQLVTLNGPKQTLLITEQRVLLTTNQQTTEFAANRLHFSPLPLDNQWSAKQLQQHYDLQPVGMDRVAGLDSYVLNIVPRDDWRFGHRVWLSREHGLLLRSAVLDAKQAIREQLVFTHVDLALEAPLSPPPTIFLKPMLPVSNGVQSPEQTPWQLKTLPPGFRLQRIQPADQNHANQWVFSDGLATVSVFIRPLAPQQPALQGALQVGATNAYAAIRQQHQLVAMGEVPEKTLQALTASLQPR